MPEGAQQAMATSAAASVFDKYARGAAAAAAAPPPPAAAAPPPAVDRRVKREHEGSDDDFEGGVGKVGKVRRKLQ